jgi:hypothetical protein
LGKEMIAKILSRINKGACTQDVLEQELGISKNKLMALLEFIVREGYLEETVCETKCRACPLKCAILTPVKMYKVTSKGMKYIKNEGYGT